MRKLFKKAHLWFSLPLGIVITITCFSGAMLIFEKEITQIVQHDYYYTKSVDSKPLPIDELLANVEPLLGEGRRITGVTISDDPERSYKVNINIPKHAVIFVDQYTGEVLGEPGRLEFFKVMFRLHRWLMDSKPEDGAIYWGKVIVGISTLLMVIIILTGVVLWWPKGIKGLKNRSKIEIRKGWSRFWYDLHVVGGVYATLLLLAMALTGLTWSFKWYGNGFYSLFGVETKSANISNNAPKGNTRTTTSERYIHWQSAVDKVKDESDTYTEVTVSDGSVSVKQAGWGNQRASDKYTFDNQSGEITAITLYADSDYNRKVRGWVYTIHVGNWGGYLSRVMWFLAAMLGATLPLTGYYIWIRRMLKKRNS
ncbi:MAG: PepSY domain-containing protein [Alistipes sp.]|nr:PepSY domain-containing protein [Alistipes sp.]